MENRAPSLQYVRKQLYVVEGVPALAIDKDMYVRGGLTSAMDDNDLLILGIMLSLKNHDWRDRVLERVREQMVGATTNTSRMTRALAMLKPETT